MTKTMNQGIVHRDVMINIRMTSIELERLDNAWLEHRDHMTRTHYIRAAINQYAGMEIFQSDFDRKLENSAEKKKKNESED